MCHKFHNAEYLVHRGIERTWPPQWLCFSIVPIRNYSTSLNASLYDLLPRLRNFPDEGGLHGRVQDLRTAFFDRLFSLSDNEVRLLTALALRLGADWTISLAVTLLATIVRFDELESMGHVMATKQTIIDLKARLGTRKNCGIDD